jgi:hypothetical protein
MPDDNRKSDAFKPQQPKIPGVSDAPAETSNSSAPGAAAPASKTSASESVSKTSESEGLPAWITLSIAGVLILIIAGVWWSHRSAPQQTVSVPAAMGAEPPAEVASKVRETLPIGPGEIASTEELAKPWSSKRFVFRNQLTDEQMPAMVVRLPNGVYWGFSLREPYGSCEMEWVTDLNKLETDYGFRSQHPMIGDPCNHSVFDLTRYGNGPNGLVRGEIVHGAAVRPPMAIEVREQGKKILAVRME